MTSKAARKAPRRATKSRSTQPDDGVYVRIGRSLIDGVGVIALRDIPKGARVFGDDEEEMLWVPLARAARLPAMTRALYEDFCVRKGGKYGCPRNFNLMTAAWYLNHSDNPNVEADTDYQFFAKRRIRGGEELTAVYRQYSDDPFPWLRRKDPAYRSREPTPRRTGPRGSRHK